ncbi:MAG: glycosyltransferase [Proteobacteria bacterium]|nr:glycosyltransferase [Pseudomonadota bacterium]
MPSPPAAKRRLLVFEPDAEGHSLEWLEHLVAFVDSGTELIILAAAPLCEALGRALPAGARVRLLPLSRWERRLCLQRPLPIAAFARWWTMRRHLRRTGADTGFFLMLDLQSLPFALGLGMDGRRVSGILFRPSVHYGEIGPYSPGPAERRRDRRKELLYRRMLANPAVDRVLSLDPFFPDYARRQYRYGGKVDALPDPVHPPVATATTAEPVPEGRVSFLLFGYLAERKGPLAVLDALALLPPHIARRVAVRFAGKVDPGLRYAIDQRCRALETTQPRLWLRVDDRRLGSGELAALVNESDVVLAPYQRFVGSSGVLLWAARAGRPVLAQEFGLIGKLTRDNRLGVAVDSGDSEELAREIVRMVECGPETFIDHAAAGRFVAAQTPQRFASLVLSV